MYFSTVTNFSLVRFSVELGLHTSSINASTLAHPSKKNINCFDISKSFCSAWVAGVFKSILSSEKVICHFRRLLFHLIAYCFLNASVLLMVHTAYYGRSKFVSNWLKRAKILNYFVSYPGNWRWIKSFGYSGPMTRNGKEHPKRYLLCFWPWKKIRKTLFLINLIADNVNKDGLLICIFHAYYIS